MASTTITAIIGDYYHKKADIAASLEAAITAHGLADSIKIEYAAYDELSAKLKQRPQAVILFMENRLNPGKSELTWMTREIAESIVNYVRQGGNWFAWHSGLASFEKVSDYVTMLRGYFLTHPEEHSIVTYEAVENELGVASDAAFSMLDEHYFITCDEANTKIFLRSSTRDGASIAGWYHHEGEGKVCCLVPAHLAEGLINPELLAILGPILRWITTKGQHCIEKG